MPYIGRNHVAGDHTSNFKVLDDISSYTATFNGSLATIVSTADDTLRVPEHRFIQGQRVTYSNGGGGNIGGLTNGTAYFVTFDTANTFKLATSLANANNNTNINLSSVGSGSSHTLTAAFDGTNTKFKLTHNGGESSRLNNATQLQVAINNVLQRPNIDPNNFTEGFAVERGNKIVFQTAPTSNDVFWGSIIANTLETFDISDNKVENFTGDGSTTEFNLSRVPPNNGSIVVTINGVLQHASDATTARAYSLASQLLIFTSAPANGDEIQARHIGFAGASTGQVSGFYGRTGNVVLGASDHITTGDITSSNINASGIVTASSFSGGFSGNIVGTSATFTGNLSVGGVLTYEDVTNVDSVGIITAQKDIHVGAGVSAVGVGTFGSLDIGGDIDVDGHTNLDNVSVAGVSTFAGNADFSSGVDVTGNVTVTNNVNAQGNITAQGNLTANGGRLTFTNNAGGQIRFMDSNNNPDYRIESSQGNFQIDQNDGSDPIIKVNTDKHVDINYNLDLASGLDVIGATNLRNTNISRDLDVDGHTNLDNVSIVGVTTFNLTNHPEPLKIISNNTANNISTYLFTTNQGNHDIRFEHNHAGNWNIHDHMRLVWSAPNDSYPTGDLFSIQPRAGVPGFTHVEFKVNDSSSGLVDAYRSAYEYQQFMIRNSVVLQMNQQGIGVTNRIYHYGYDNDFIQFGHNLMTFNIGSATDNRIVLRNNMITFQNLAVGVDIDADLDVDGHTNLDNVSIAGVSTFTGTISANNHIELASGKKLSMAGDVFKIYHSTNAAIINESGDLIINQNVSNKDIKISTGSGPTERLRISSSGVSCFSKTHASTGVVEPGNFILNVHTGAELNDGIKIVTNYNSGNQNSDSGKLMFCGEGQSNGVYIYKDNAISYGKGDMVFHTKSTANDYTTQLSETARFTAYGRFGLGTGGPGQTTVDSLMHIQGNSDNGDEACQLTIEDSDTTSGSVIPQIVFKGNGSQLCKIRATDSNIIRIYDNNDAERWLINEYGETISEESEHGWSTYEHHAKSGGTRFHYRQVGTGASGTTINLIRVRRHYWGSGNYKIKVRQTYYNGSYESHFWLNGHAANGANSFSLQHQGQNGGNSSWIQKTAASHSAPGNNYAGWTDVFMSLGAYEYYEIIIEASMMSSYSHDINNIGNDGYALHAF